MIFELYSAFNLCYSHSMLHWSLDENKKDMDERKREERIGEGKFNVETLELKIIWVNGTHATVNPARRIRGQRRQKLADAEAETEETR